jgi:hypothetical protein
LVKQIGKNVNCFYDGKEKDQNTENFKNWGLTSDDQLLINSQTWDTSLVDSLRPGRTLALPIQALRTGVASRALDVVFTASLARVDYLNRTKLKVP